MNTHFDSIQLNELPARTLRPDSSDLLPIVLVVDDEQLIADTLAMILSHSGFAPLVAYGPEDALEIAKLVPPDLLITDVAMPGMNGVDLASLFRRNWPNCGILLFSGQASPTDLLDTLRKSGKDFGFLSKPVHPDVMLSHIRQLVHRPN